MDYTCGMTIKSFDFPGNASYFMIGRITKIDGDYLYCETISHVQAGVEQAVNRPTFRTVKQGAMMMDESFDRIVVVS